MKGNIKSLIFTKILAFSALIWICLYSNKCNFGISMEKNYTLDGYSCLAINRLLSECSLNVMSTGYMSNENSKNELITKKKNISMNCEDPKIQRKIIKDILLKSEERNRLHKKKKSSLLNKIETYFEKRILNQLVSIDEIKYNTDVHKKTAGMIRKNGSPKINILYLVILIGLLFEIFVILYTELTKNKIAALNASAMVVSFILVFVVAITVLCINYIFKKIEEYNIKKANNLRICYNIVNSSSRSNFYYDI
ncbi:Plasmodium exported protein, unknown function [Plasmodium malariae]|uniref:Variable surface protein n=1 Tax=Plasmodium malariae TaxID=5858 RepID=A0A1D3JHQ1_PLAMA|nr:Plasmodium exported protein, unknown function [Plasmodium malariae]SBT85954.1 Plasmodium exported protein, unknown function [Plasmodium malariae]